MCQMSTPDSRGIFDDFVAEILEQQGFHWQEEPRSVYDPQQLYSALERYATEWDKYEQMDEHLKYGFEKAFQIFARPKDCEPLAVLSDTEVVHSALKLGKSSGLPMMSTKEQSLTYSFDREHQVRLGVKSPNPCVAYKRTQKGNKTRLVWGYPLEMTIMEARFARPLIDHFLQVSTPMAFGMTKCELGAKIHAYFVNQPGVTVCLDYSKYDTTLSATMIRQAFRILGTWFTEDDKHALGWKIVQEYFVSTPIVMPNGHLYVGKRHGVPSGSYFTQMIDSIVNVAIIYSLVSSCGLRFNQRGLYVLGDDVIVQVTSQVELELWSTYLRNHYGLQLHDDEKTVVGEPHFLGAFWFKGKPDVSVQELVNKAVFPESFRDYEGQPHSGALDVLRSYASNYLSGYRFLPRGFHSMRGVDYPYDRDKLLNSKFLSGSDKYLFEEKRMSESLSSGPVPTLALRILL